VSVDDAVIDAVTGTDAVTVRESVDEGVGVEEGLGQAIAYTNESSEPTYTV
jgi:hypothetical protein